MVAKVPENYVYLDYAATAPLCEEAAQAMAPYMVPGRANIAFGGNANSLHVPGRAAFSALEDARRAIARALGATRPDEVVLTSGATEADNAAAQALVDQGKIKVTLSGIDSTIFLEATVTTETDTCTVTIRGSHTNIVSIVCNGATVFEKTEDHAAEPGEEPTPLIHTYTLAQLAEYAQTVPMEEIAFIHTADSEAKKKELFSKVRSGQVRVLLGSTAKMGAGTNVQDKLIALHDLDCPWRPSDLQQRLGRIVRQGNENEEVEIYRYVTEGTFDAYLYQLVENKQKFIAQIMTSKAPVRVADDVDETALSYSEIKALATGNPLIIEKCNLDMEVARLNMLKASHLNQVYALEELVYRKYPEEITRLTELIEGYGQDVALAAAHPKAQEGFCGMEVDGRHYAEKEDAGKAIIDVCTRMTGSDAVLLGQYRGFSMVLAYDGRSNEYRITLKGTLSHTVTLGADVFGNITRLDNALENLAGSLEAEQNRLEETRGQLENARAELQTPFAREAELAEKTKRLKELNILLNMDEKDKTLMDDGPDEGEEMPERKVVGLER